MYRLEVFVCTVFEAGAQAPCTPLQPLGNRGFLFKIDGKPVVPLALTGAEVSYAPEAGFDNTVWFEALISARASGSWLLGPAYQARGGGTLSPVQQQQQLVLHVLYTVSRPSEGGKTLGDSGSCLPTVLGVCRLLLPVLDARKGAAASVQQAQQRCNGLGSLACPPIQVEALQECRLSCPNSGVDVGSVSLAARLSIVEAPATDCSSGSRSNNDMRPVQQPVCHQEHPVQASTQRQVAPSPEKFAQRHAGTQASPTRHKASAPAAAQQGQPAYPWPAIPLPYPSVPMVPAMGLPLMWGLPPVATPVWQCNLPAPFFPATPWGLSTCAAGAAPAVSEGLKADWGAVRPERVPSQPVKVTAQATDAQLLAERLPSRHACTQTADEKVVERRCLRLREACSDESSRQDTKYPTPRELLKSPLKPQPTPLLLEHHLEAVPRSRSPSQRHRAMVKSALDNSGAFYCPGCLRRFMQLPQSPSRAQVQEAMASCGCTDCSTQLRCSSPPAAVRPVAGLGTGAAGGWEGEDASSSCGCHGCGGSPTAAARRKSSPGRGLRPGSPARPCSSSRPGTQLQQRWQLDGAGQAGAAAAVETGSMRQQGAIAAAPLNTSSDGPQVQLTPEAAALQQLLTSLNLSSDWQARVLGPLAAAAVAVAASPPVTVSRMVAPAMADSIAAITSQNVPALQSPSKAQPALSRPGGPAEGSCREETSQSSLGESSFASHSSAAGSRAGTPRRHWVPAGAAGAGSSVGSPASTPRHKTRGTKITNHEEGSPQKVCQTAGFGSSAGARGRRESSLGDSLAVAVVQPTSETSAASSREGRGGPPTEKQRKPGVAQSVQGPYRAPPRKADTMQDIISRNQQLLQLMKPGSGSGRGCHGDDSQPNSPRQDSHDGASVPTAAVSTAWQPGGIDVDTRTDSLLERVPPYESKPLHAVSGQSSPLAERLGSFKVTIDGTSVVCTKRSSGNTSGEDSSGCQSARETQDASALGQPTIGTGSGSGLAQLKPPLQQGQLASSSSGEAGRGESAENIIARLACYRSGSSGEEPVEPFSASTTDSEIAEPNPGWATGLDRLGACGGARAVGQIGAAAVLLARCPLPPEGANAKAVVSGDAEALISCEVEDATASDVYEDDFEAGSDAEF